MPKTPSSRRWLKEHAEDPFVKKAQRDGYRSRAVYKLSEIDGRDRLLKPGMTVVDLGAAPGGWSQYAAARIGPQGRVLALDLLPMEPLPGVTCIQGDFQEQAVLETLLELLGDGKADLVLSDMAPNMSGLRGVDQPRAMALAELAVDCAFQVLRPGGDLLLKVFQGEGLDALLLSLRGRFRQVLMRKPKASRGRSPEVYVLARGYQI